jgi:hypothetical protein
VMVLATECTQHPRGRWNIARSQLLLAVLLKIGVYVKRAAVWISEYFQTFRRSTVLRNVGN